MEKLFVILAIFALVFVGCEDGTNSGNDNVNNVDNTPTETKPKTTLKIKNESSFSLRSIRWQNTSFSNLNSGQSSSEEFSTSTELSGYIYFSKPIIGGYLPLRTQSIINVSNEENVEFVFTDNTIVVDIEHIDNTTILRTIDGILSSPYVTWSITGVGAIRMRWDSVNNATGYTVYEKLPDGTLIPIQTYTNAQGFFMEFNLNGIPSGRTLYFVVRASDNYNRWSEESNLITVYFH